MRSLDAEALNAHAQAILDGNAERFLLAHARSPLALPHVLAEVVPAALVDVQTKADPAAARLGSQAKARVEHLSMIAGQAEAALPPLSAEQRKAAAIAAAMAGRTA